MANPGRDPYPSSPPKFLYFRIRFCQKAPVLEVDPPPPMGSALPNGKSWIRHCVCSKNNTNCKTVVHDITVLISLQ